MWAQFSTIRMRYNLDLPDTTGRDIEETREDIGDGIAAEASLGLDDLGPVSVAVHWVGDHNEDVKVRQRGVALSNRSDSSRQDEVPGRMEAGMRLDLPGTWSAGLDYQVQFWSRYSGRKFRYTDGVYDPNGVAADLHDETTWHFGIERESRRVGIGQTWPLRVGGYYRKWHYSLEGSRVTEWGVTAGSGVLLSGGRARVDAALGFSHIGDQNTNGASENVVRLFISIAGSERWY
jgi:hypothetical protein